MRLLGDSNIRKERLLRRSATGAPGLRHPGMGVDTQVAERASSGLEGGAPQRGLAGRLRATLQGAPYAKRKRLQNPSASTGSGPRPSLRHSRHWLSTDQRRYAAADAWATLAVYKKLETRGATFELRRRGGGAVAGPAARAARRRRAPTTCGRLLIGASPARPGRTRASAARRHNSNHMTSRDYAS